MPLLRAANNGISAVVDARGRIIDALAMDARGVLDVRVPIAVERLLSAGQRSINGFGILLLMFISALFLSVRQRLPLD